MQAVRHHDVATKCRDWDAALARAQQIERDAVNPGAAKQGAATVGVACGLYLENKQKLVAREKGGSQLRAASLLGPPLDTRWPVV